MAYNCKSPLLSASNNLKLCVLHWKAVQFMVNCVRKKNNKMGKNNLCPKGCLLVMIKGGQLHTKCVGNTPGCRAPLIIISIKKAALHRGNSHCRHRDVKETQHGNQEILMNNEWIIREWLNKTVSTLILLSIYILWVCSNIHKNHFRWSD